MIFEEATLSGAYSIELEKRGDERGFFARAWCRREFEELGLNTAIVQANISRTQVRGTVRGMHMQVAPAAETKLIRCVRGAILDVIVDLRPDSQTFRGWEGFELSDSNHTAVYVPEGFAHGFQSLTDDVELFYQVTAFYSPDHERGIRYDDPAIGIEWPLEVSVLSDKDSRWPPLVAGGILSAPPIDVGDKLL